MTLFVRKKCNPRGICITAEKSVWREQVSRVLFAPCGRRTFILDAAEPRADEGYGTDWTAVSVQNNGGFPPTLHCRPYATTLHYCSIGDIIIGAFKEYDIDYSTVHVKLLFSSNTFRHSSLGYPSTVGYGTVGYGTVRYGTVQYGSVGEVWFGYPKRKVWMRSDFSINGTGRQVIGSTIFNKP